jgi:uncharacterized protein
MLKSLQLLWTVFAGLLFAFDVSTLSADAPQAAQSAESFRFNRPPLVQNHFARLPFGSVMPEGWLKRQLQISADGLARHLLDPNTFDRVLGPCKQNGEAEITYQQGVYQEGVITLAWMTRDEVFLKKAKESVNKTLAEDPTELGETQANFDAVLYKRSRQLRSFIEYYEATHDERILSWMAKFFHAWGKSEKKLSWWPESATTDLFLVGFWLYNQTGDAALLDVIKAKSRFVQPVADSFLRFPQGDYEKHNVVIAWISRLPGIVYQLSPEDRFRQATFEGIDRREKWFGQIGGRYTGHEHFTKLENGRKPTNGTELCGVVEYMYSMEKLFEIFGEVSLADRLESLAYNALPGACTADLFFHQYDQQANQVNVSVAKRGFDNSETANLYGIAPHYPCCSFNRHQAWPRLVEHLWMASPDGGLAAVAYGPCRVETTVAAGQSVTIVETTDYPFDGQIRLKLSLKAPTSFPLYLRIPAWAEGASFSYRGEKIACTPGALFKIQRTWQPDDECLLSLPMEVRTETRLNNSIAVLRGPLYFSLRIAASYRDVDKKEYWEILPTSPWNYGLELSPETAAKNSKVIQNPVGDFPFAGRGEPLSRRSSNAVVQPDGRISDYTRTPYSAMEPIVLKVKGRLIPDWGMDKTYPANAADPPASPAKSNLPEVDLELVPYGCARLRISEFPWFKPNQAEH